MFNRFAKASERIKGFPILKESKVFQPRIDAINKQLDEIRELRRSKSAACDKLIEAIKSCQELIEEIHKAFPA